MKPNVFGLIGFLLTCTCLGINTPANARPSSYQDTCSNIYVYGNRLTAKCQKVDGRWQRTSIVLRGIENIDGTLKTTDDSYPSNYQDSCSRIFLRGNRLMANCRTLDGDWKKTSIFLHGIENINGNLRYTSSP